MRVALIGPGAIGAVVAEALCKHNELVVCSRQQINTLSVEYQSNTTDIRATFLTDPASAPPVDCIVVTTKAYDAESAAKWFPALTGAGTPPVVIIQNGVEHKERFAPFVSPSRIVIGIINCQAERITPTLVRRRNAQTITVPNDAHGRQFASLFTDSDAHIILSDDIMSAAWQKLCLNVTGALNAILLEPVRVVVDNPDVAELSHELVRECVAVGRASGAELADDMPERVFQQYKQSNPEAINSLHADRANGRRLEIDIRNGVVVRFGKQLGIPTPYNTMAVTLLKAMAAKDERKQQQQAK